MSNNQSLIVDYILQLISQNKIEITELATKSGIKYSNLHSILKKKRAIGDSTILKLSKVFNLTFEQLKYPSMDSENKEGETNKNNTALTDKNFDEPKNQKSDFLVSEYKRPYRRKKELQLPFYDIDITAGNMPLFQDNDEEPVHYYSMPSFADCDAIFPIYGESMNPRFKPGDRVIVKEYTHFTDYIRFGEVYLVFTINEERMIKIVKKSNKEGYVKLSSSNPDYDDFEIRIDQITKMFLVRGKFSIENQ